ncbi:hypothetical protein JW905_13520, partial [bacterium]|nr:hypothetical protein [candidate division CSSED10-310 bacterium]
RQAQEVGLVDQVGDLSAAVEKAREKAGIKGEAELVYITTKTSLLGRLLENSVSTWLGLDLLTGARGAQFATPAYLNSFSER